MNPPGAWAVAVRDAPNVAEQLWTFHTPKGPQGRFDPCNFGFWGIWNFSANATAAKSLLAYLSTRASVEKLVVGSHGVDIPPFEKLRDLKTWEEEKPPVGTLYNYPPRGNVTALLAGYPTPREAAHRLAEGAAHRAERASTGMTTSLPRWVHRNLPRAAPPDSWRSRRSARVPPMHYLDKLPRRSLEATSL